MSSHTELSSFHRKRKRSIASRRQNSTSWWRTWKDFKCYPRSCCTVCLHSFVYRLLPTARPHGPIKAKRRLSFLIVSVRDVSYRYTSAYTISEASYLPYHSTKLKQVSQYMKVTHAALKRELRLCSVHSYTARHVQPIQIHVILGGGLLLICENQSFNPSLILEVEGYRIDAVPFVSCEVDQ